MTDPTNVSLSPTGGVMLPPEPDERIDALAAAESGGATYDSLAPLVARWPDFLAGWAALGDTAHAEGRTIEAYAYYRVGYHRSLDRLRGNGWRGAGRVPFAHGPNQAFHAATAGLARCSAEIGDDVEAQRCIRMLLDADPSDPLSSASLQ